MVELFIIGNGFDLRHGMETKYSDFKSYLEQYYPDDYRMINALFADETNLGLLWSSFEEALGNTSNIDVRKLFNEIMGELRGVSLEEAISIIDSRCLELSHQRNRIPDLIFEWIKYAELKKPIKKIEGIRIKLEDYLLIFNYTVCTIEQYVEVELGNIDHFCYIHNNVAGEYVIVGHNSPDQYKFDIEPPSLIEEFGDGTFRTKELHEVYSVEELLKRKLNNINHILYKDPNNKIHQKDGFFKNLKIVDGITILGWSLGSIDMPYMDAVMEHTRSNIPITVVYYDQDTKNRYVSYFKDKSDRFCYVSYLTWDEYESRNI